MHITRTPLAVRSEWYSRDYGVERTAGAHLKQTLEYIQQTAGYEKKYDEIPDPSIDDVLERYAACGFIWEHVMSRELAEVYRLRQTELASPGELMWCYHCNRVFQGGELGRQHVAARGHKGIFATPDGRRAQPWRVAEFKFTWKSAGRMTVAGEPDGNGAVEVLDLGIWMWPNQTLGYAHLMEAEEAELYAMFAVGDYSDRGRPEPLAYRFDMEFKPREAKRVWDMIVVNAIDAGYLEV